MSGSASYYMPYYSGPVTDRNGNPTAGFTRYQMAIFNRTGKERGTDTAYDTQRITAAISAANKAETDAQSAIGQASSAQGTATMALAEAQSASAEVTVLGDAVKTAEVDAQSALLAAQDVLILTLLTSSAQWAKAAQSLDDAALMAAQSQIWPSLLLQSSQA